MRPRRAAAPHDRNPLRRGAHPEAVQPKAMCAASTHLASGQEAVAVGIARSIDVDDIVTCTYRGHSPCAGARRHAAGRDRRNLRPHDRLRRRPRRLDASGRTLGRADADRRDHRRRPADRLRRSACRARPRHRPRRGRDLRRRLGQYRRLSRIAELRGDPEAAGRVRLREQSLRRVQPHQPDDPGRGHRRACRQLRHARRHRRRPGRRRGRRGDGDRRSPAPAPAKGRRWSR